MVDFPIMPSNHIRHDWTLADTASIYFLLLFLFQISFCCFVILTYEHASIFLIFMLCFQAVLGVTRVLSTVVFSDGCVSSLWCASSHSCSISFFGKWILFLIRHMCGSAVGVMVRYLGNSEEGFGSPGFYCTLHH